MPSQTIVTTTVTRATAIPTQVGFGVPLLAVYHSVVGPLVREFGSTSEIADLFSTDPNYAAIKRMTDVVFAQRPAPSRIKIGRRTTGALTQSFLFAPIAPQGAGYVWAIEADGATASYTEQPADAVADIVAGLVAAPGWAGLDLTVTNSGPGTAVSVVAATANVVHTLAADLDVLTVTETTADPGISTDLTAFQGYDEDWYGLALDSQSQAEVVAAATWVSTRVKLLVADTYLSDGVDTGVSTDTASVLGTAQRDKAVAYWTEGRIGYYYGLGALAYMLAAWEPGRATWHLQRLRGVPIYGVLSQGRQAAIESKNQNHLEFFSDADRTIGGVTATGEFVDVVRYDAYIQARSRETLQNLLARQTDLQGKIPYTDQGISLVGDTLRAFYDAEIEAGALISAEVTTPTRAEISTTNLAARILPDVTADLIYAGAIHEVVNRIILSL